MGRILFWLILGFLFWLVVRVLLTQRKPDGQAGRGTSAAPAEKKQLTMSQCAWCGIHFPAVEAVQATDGRSFCSQAHHDQALHAHGS